MDARNRGEASQDRQDTDEKGTNQFIVGNRARRQDMSDGAVLVARTTVKVAASAARP